MLTIFHNPRCSKSRQALAIIEESGVEHAVHLYLENPMPVDILKKALETLGEDVMCRKGESDYKEHVKGKNLDTNSLVQTMLTYPKIIERALVVSGNEMVMGRPPENVKGLL